MRKSHTHWPFITLTFAVSFFLDIDSANSQNPGIDPRATAVEGEYRNFVYEVMGNESARYREIRQQVTLCNHEKLDFSLQIEETLEGHSETIGESHRQTQNYSAQRGPLRMQLQLSDETGNWMEDTIADLYMWDSWVKVIPRYLDAVPLLATWTNDPAMALQRAQVEWDLEHKEDWLAFEEYVKSLSEDVAALRRLLEGVVFWSYSGWGFHDYCWDAEQQVQFQGQINQQFSYEFSSAESTFNEQSVSNSGSSSKLEESRAAGQSGQSENSDQANAEKSWRPGTAANAITWHYDLNDWQRVIRIYDRLDEISERLNPQSLEFERRDYHYRPAIEFYLRSLTSGLNYFECMVRRFRPEDQQTGLVQGALIPNECHAWELSQKYEFQQPRHELTPPAASPILLLAIAGQGMEFGNWSWPYQLNRDSGAVTGFYRTINEDGEVFESQTNDLSFERMRNSEQFSTRFEAGKEESWLQGQDLIMRRSLNGGRAADALVLARRGKYSDENTQSNENRQTRISWQLVGDLLEPEAPNLVVSEATELDLSGVTSPMPLITGKAFSFGIHISNPLEEPRDAGTLVLRLLDSESQSPWQGFEPTDTCEEYPGAIWHCPVPVLAPGEEFQLILNGEAAKDAGAMWWQATMGPFRANGLISTGPPPLDIYGILPLQRQLYEYRGIYSYPYPFVEGRSPRGDARRLLLIGKGLPKEGDEYPQIKSDNPSIRYRMAAWPETTSPLWQPIYSEARERVIKIMGKAGEDVDLFIIEAFLSEGILPGHQTLTINEVEATWRLRFGGLAGYAQFVRKLPNDALETLDTAYLPEKVRPAIQLTYSVPLEIIEAELKTTKPSGLTTQNISLVKSEDIPGLYLGPEISLSAPRQNASAGDVDITVHGNQVKNTFVSFKVTDKFRDEKLDIRYDPVEAQIGTAVTPGRWLFRDALSRVTRCNEVDITNWSTLSDQEAETISNLMFFTRGSMKVSQSVSFGHMAAMVLMRDGFVELMKREEQKLRDILADPKAVQGFARYLRDYSLDEGIAALRMQATDLDGNELEFRYLLYESVEEIAEKRDMPLEEVQSWLEAQTRVVINKVINASIKVREDADKLGDCDGEDLLEITGAGFEPVRQHLYPRMMGLIEPEPMRLQWIPDREARHFLAAVDALSASVKEQERRARIDTDLALLAVSVATLPFAFAENATLMMIGLGVDALGLVGTATHELIQLKASKDEIAFAGGASLVIGDARYEQAVAQAKTWVTTTFNIGTAALGFAASAYEAIPAFVMASRVRRGEQLVSRAASQGLESFNQSELLDLASFATNARARSIAEGADTLIETERMVISVFDTLAETGETGVVLKNTQQLAAVEFVELAETGELVMAPVAAERVVREAVVADDLVTAMQQARTVEQKLLDLGMSGDNAEILAEIVSRQMSSVDEAVIAAAWQKGTPRATLIDAGYSEAQIRAAMGAYCDFRGVSEGRKAALIDDYLGGETLVINPPRAADDLPETVSLDNNPAGPSPGDETIPPPAPANRGDTVPPPGPGDTVPPPGPPRFSDSIDADTVDDIGTAMILGIEDSRRFELLYELRSQQMQALMNHTPGTRSKLTYISDVIEQLGKRTPEVRSAALKLAESIIDFGQDPLDAWRFAGLKSARGGDPVMMHAELLAEYMVAPAYTFSLSKYVERTGLPLLAARSKIEQEALRKGLSVVFDGDTLRFVR